MYDMSSIQVESTAQSAGTVPSLAHCAVPAAWPSWTEVGHNDTFDETLKCSSWMSIYRVVGCVDCVRPSVLRDAAFSCTESSARRTNTVPLITVPYRTAGRRCDAWTCCCCCCCWYSSTFITVPLNTYHFTKTMTASSSVVSSSCHNPHWIEQ